jgi:hypothetical protein
MAITQTISTIPQAGKRGVDLRTVFVTKQEAFQDTLTDITVDELNTFKDQANALATDVNNDATSASTSAGNAATSETNAAASETNALASENKAEEWATQDEDVNVTGTSEYSAKHYSAKAAASAASAATFDPNDYYTKTVSDDTFEPKDTAIAKEDEDNTFTGDNTFTQITETHTAKTASFTPNLSTEGTVFDVSGTVTVTMPTHESGKSFVVNHDGTGTLSWSGTIEWVGGTIPTYSGATTFVIFSDGSGWRGILSGQGFA